MSSSNAVFVATNAIFIHSTSSSKSSIFVRHPKTNLSMMMMIIKKGEREKRREED